jgi:hypothetical protein
MITHFNIITFTLNYVINFEFQNSFNCLALKVIYVHFDVYMDCCSLSVTGPQTSTSQAILIKRYSKHYRHNVKSPYECFMDQNGVHGYWNNKVFYCHWPSTSDIKTFVCSKYLRKIYSVSVTVLDAHTFNDICYLKSRPR